MSCSSNEVGIETDKSSMMKLESETNIFKTNEKTNNEGGNTMVRDVSEKVTEKLQEIINTETRQELDLVETITNSLEDMNCKNVVSEQENAVTDLKGSTEKIQSDIELKEPTKLVGLIDSANNANGPQVSSTVTETLLEDMSILGISDSNKTIHSKVVINHQTDSLKKLWSYQSSSDECDESDFEADWQLEMLNDTDSADSSEDSGNDLSPVYIKK